MSNLVPQVGSWYKDLQQGAIFEVVAIDDSIEAQLLDGEICEFDLESWEELALENIEEPDDWRSPFELSSEDYHDFSELSLTESWDNPLSNIEPEFINGLTDDY